MVNILQIVALPKSVFAVYRDSCKDADLTDPTSYWTEELFLVGVVQRQDQSDHEVFSIAELLHMSDCGTFDPVSDSHAFVNWFKTQEEADGCASALLKSAVARKESPDGK